MLERPQESTQQPLESTQPTLQTSRSQHMKPIKNKNRIKSVTPTQDCRHYGRLLDDSIQHLPHMHHHIIIQSQVTNPEQ
jgi:hypothetical protein